MKHDETDENSSRCLSARSYPDKQLSFPQELVMYKLDQYQYDPPSSSIGK